MAISFMQRLHSILHRFFLIYSANCTPWSLWLPFSSLGLQFGVRGGDLGRTIADPGALWLHFECAPWGLLGGPENSGLRRPQGAPKERTQRSTKDSPLVAFCQNGCFLGPSRQPFSIKVRLTVLLHGYCKRGDIGRGVPARGQRGSNNWA